MSPKKLSAVLGNVDVLERVGDGDPPIHGIAYDSRRVASGYLFFALDGLHNDGHLFVEEAIQRGAVAVVHRRPLSNYHRGIVYVRTGNPRFALSPVSADYYDHPSEKLDVIGVTGTDGKSTTVYFIHQLLSALGRRSGFLSTVQIMAADTIEKNPYRQSTPEASEIHSILAEMQRTGKKVVVLEATSHGLSQRTNRLGDVRFRVGVLTNITHEHLEFHGSLQQYVDDKANLFRALHGSGAFGVVNGDDDHATAFREAAGVPVYSYGRSEECDLYATALHPDGDGTDFIIASKHKRLEARINLPGIFNVENALAALLAVWKHTGETLPSLVRLLPKLVAPSGRMHAIRRGQPFGVIVDYAHTPGAFEKLLPPLRAQTKGKLIAVFGSAGERDIEKRSLLGEIAGRYCDLLVLTDEDPRGENSLSIIEEIASGAAGTARGKNVLMIPDRREAISAAYNHATAGDLVLLLGKGHETSIIYADGPRQWDEITAAMECLAELGYETDPDT